MILKLWAGNWRAGGPSALRASTPFMSPGPPSRGRTKGDAEAQRQPCLGSPVAISQASRLPVRAHPGGRLPPMSDCEGWRWGGRCVCTYLGGAGGTWRGTMFRHNVKPRGQGRGQNPVMGPQRHWAGRQHHCWEQQTQGRWPDRQTGGGEGPGAGFLGPRPRDVNSRPSAAQSNVPRAPSPGEHKQPMQGWEGVGRLGQVPGWLTAARDGVGVVVGEV